MWVLRKSLAHRCEMPNAFVMISVEAGSVWACDDCGQQYKLLQGRKKKTWMTLDTPVRLKEGEN